MSATTHPVSPEEIMALLDGQLPTGRAQTLSAHIETCPDCRGLFQDFQKTKYNVALWQVASPPERMNARIESAAAKNSTLSSASLPAPLQLPRRLSRKQWMFGLGLTAAAMLVVFSVASPDRLRSRMASSRAVDYVQTMKEKVKAREQTKAERQVSNDTDYAVPANVQTESEPSTAADSNGPLNGRGDHIQASSYRDGQPISDQQSHVTSGPMIARTVSLTILVKDFDASRNSLDAILARHNGYSANLSVSTPQGSARSLQASLRVPAPQLAAAFAELKSLGHVETENQTGEEVSQQHADLVARLKNSRETEQRLQAILTQRTGKISDVLEVEQEIARVRGEIEQMEAEQKNLEHRVDFATIDLNLSEEYKAKLDSATPSISTKLHNALVNGYRNVADTLLGLVLFFAEYGPILVFWALLLFIPAWLVWRRWRHATAAI
jgi:DNA-binding transcriptional regulator YhcF (GntR family)